MSVSLLTKCLMGSTCSAVGLGIPIFISTEGELAKLFQISENKNSSEFVVEKCKHQGGGSSESSLEFGNKDVRKICGDFKPPENQATTVFYENKINFLFKDGGKHKSSAGSSLSHSSGKSNCINNGGSKWVLIQPSNGEYLGLCEKESRRNLNTIFLHKQTENEKVKQIKLCQQDCGDANAHSSSESLKTYQNLKNENGKEILFFKKQ